MSEEIKRPLVSVFVIAYKHEEFIGQCLDSILAQVVNFDYEIVLGEDCSPDSTRAICEAYAAKYPQINLLPSDRNYGAVGNCVRTLRECKGKYIALCEGDDYWCDNHKLQKQVDFLEANPDFSSCFSLVRVQDDMGWNKPYEYYFTVLDKDEFTIEDFITSGRNIIPTATLMFRNVLPQPFPHFFVNAIMGDIPIQLFVADKGKAKLLPGPLAVYRNHKGGMTKSPEATRKHSDEIFKLFTEFNKFTGYKYNKAFRTRFYVESRFNLVYGSAGLKGSEKWRNYKKWFPRYVKYSEKVNVKEILYYHVLLFAPALLRIAGKK